MGGGGGGGVVTHHMTAPVSKRWKGVFFRHFFDVFLWKGVFFSCTIGVAGSKNVRSITSIQNAILGYHFQRHQNWNTPFMVMFWLVWRHLGGANVTWCDTPFRVGGRGWVTHLCARDLPPPPPPPPPLLPTAPGMLPSFGKRKQLTYHLNLSYWCFHILLSVLFFQAKFYA